MKLPAPARALVAKREPTAPNDYKQYLPFLPYKLAALLAWGHSEHVERAPGGYLVIHLTGWCGELGNSNKNVRNAFREAERMGLVVGLKLGKGVVSCRLAPIITLEEI